MRSSFGFIWFYVLLNIASGEKRGFNGNEDWFWSPNFTDGTEHDNDPEREFFRHTAYPPTRVTDADTDETTVIIPDDEESTETTTHYLPTDEISTLDPVVSYYKKRKHHALRCTEKEHFNIEDEYGCQLCTCDREGAMLCTKVDCTQNSEDHEDIKDIHKKRLEEAMSSSLILREYATGCQQGTTVEAGKCTCSCVLPSVLSCPESCLYRDDKTSDDTITDDAITDSTNTPTDSDMSVYE